MDENRRTNLAQLINRYDTVNVGRKPRGTRKENFETSVGLNYLNR
jgi:hypothetical protein